MGHRYLGIPRYSRMGYGYLSVAKYSRMGHRCVGAKGCSKVEGG